MSAFAIGMTEFISVGLLPLIKDSFNTSISMAGLTVSLYAIGVTVGAPVLTPLTNKMKRKHYTGYYVDIYCSQCFSCSICNI